MGKTSIPLRIGRKKPKREMNPVEQWRYKQKQHKNLQSFLKKMKKRENGEFEEKKPKFRARSPSPQSNDPMLGNLVSASSLRIDEEMPERNIEEIRNNFHIRKTEIEIPENKKTNIEIPKPNVFIPYSINKKREIKVVSKTEISESESESDLSDYAIPQQLFFTSIPKPTHINHASIISPIAVPQDQTQILKRNSQFQFKTLLNEDRKLTDFFDSINDLM